MSQKNSIQNVAVVGAGTMGPGIAAVFAAHGFDTRLTDVKPEALERAQATVDTVYATLVREGFLAQEQADAGKGRLQITPDQEVALAGADFVLESVPENTEIKLAFFRAVEGKVSDGTILASNTSGIPITQLAAGLRRPERVIGMHWSNPPHIIPVIEVIRGERTGDAAFEAVHEVIQRLDMLTVDVLRDVPGFVENRILYAIMREALHLLESGVASAEDIDSVIRWGVGYKLAVIPPLQLLDVAGLDIYHSVASYLNADLSAAGEVSPLVREKVAQGQLGLKTGKGLFDYQRDEIPGLMGRRMRQLLDVKKAMG